jgi:hypothetical protein
MEEGRSYSSQEISRIVRAFPDSGTFRLTAAAYSASEIREEVKRYVFSDEISTEEFTVWALVALSPYVDAVTMAEAHMATVRHNLKMLYRMGERNG